MGCENCGRLTEGGYCDCMIVNGEFKGAHWRKEDDNMTQKATRAHVLADESLGGIKREYVEAERKAEVGDFIVTHFTNYFTPDKPYKVIRTRHDGVFVFDNRSKDHDLSDGNYRVLEPTDIIIIDGTRHRLDDRKAVVGERVVIVDASDTFGKYSNGSIISVQSSDEYGIANEDYGSVDGNPDGFISHGEYRVLEPFEVGPQSTDDIIANLVRRVAELERELIEYKALGLRDHLILGNTTLVNEINGIKRDVETWAQEIETLKHAEKKRPFTADMFKPFKYSELSGKTLTISIGMDGDHVTAIGREANGMSYVLFSGVEGGGK